MKKFTAKQEEAIKELQRAIDRAKKTRLRACVMDDLLYVICGSLYEHQDVGGEYGPTANAIKSNEFEYQIMRTSGFIESSGGW